MVSSASSRGVKEARRVWFERRLMQYSQSSIQELEKRTLRREIHLPSAEKRWQIPQAAEFPRPPRCPARSIPLEVHAASYFAASVRISSFSSAVIIIALSESNVCFN